MKITIESINPVQKKINFEIPSERVTEEVEKSYRTFQSQARIKGFRAGKVPRPLLERHFGDQVAAEVSSLLVKESYGQALAEQHSMQIVSQPHIVAEKLIPGQPFRYSATVEVRPEVSVQNYEGIEVEKRVRTIGDHEIEQALNRLAEAFAQVHPVTDRDYVEPGDALIVDYVAFQRGKPVAGLQGKNQLVELGEEKAPPGFREHLIGVRKGETVQFSLPRSEAEAASNEPEETPTFRVTVHDIARKEKPPLDDEFAKDHGECSTLEELRERVRENLQKAADRQTERQMEDELFTRLLVSNPFEVPPSLVQEQLRRMLTESGLLRPGDDHSINESSIPEPLRDELTARARKQVQTVFLLDAVATHLGLSVSDDELRNRIDEILASVGPEHRSRLEAFYSQSENQYALQDRLRQEKALRFLVEKAKIRMVEEGVAGEGEKD
jgi:trigger factor